MNRVISTILRMQMFVLALLYAITNNRPLAAVKLIQKGKHLRLISFENVTKILISFLFKGISLASSCEGPYLHKAIR